MDNLGDTKSITEMLSRPPYVRSRGGRPSSRGQLPSGMVTFLMSDVVGSTRMWEQHPDQMDSVLEAHDKIIEEAVAAAQGSLLQFRGEGDSTFSVFSRASDALAAAVGAQLDLRNYECRCSAARTSPRPTV
jgi:class 3 adenylate cyclase